MFEKNDQKPLNGRAEEAHTEADSSDTQDSMDRLSMAFETSARRWELIVYPSLFAFILLAAYGFYLIFSLAKDIHFLALSVDSNMNIMSSNLMSMTDSVGQLSANVRTMAVSVESEQKHLQMVKSDPRRCAATNQRITGVLLKMVRNDHLPEREIQAVL